MQSVIDQTAHRLSLRAYRPGCELIEQGYPIFGYCPWSFVDARSSHQGFAKRYGLVFVIRTDDDIKTCGRIPQG